MSSNEKVRVTGEVGLERIKVPVDSMNQPPQCWVYPETKSKPLPIHFVLVVSPSAMSTRWIIGCTEFELYQ